MAKGSELKQIYFSSKFGLLTMVLYYSHVAILFLSIFYKTLFNLLLDFHDANFLLNCQPLMHSKNCITVVD